ncbi:MAG: nucleotidyltransferase domain-containing protein [Candidatus Aenigmatarchaeota archaeon]
MTIENLEEELEDVELARKEDQEQAELQKKFIEKVVKFANEARKQYGNLIKSVVIFGSVAKGVMKKGSDVDVWVILDDTATKSSEDLDKVSSQLYLIAHELKDIHIQITLLTDFWQWVRAGSPELINFLRYGLLIYDTGFVKPVQRMLHMGLLPPSEETINLKAKAAEARYKKIKLDLKTMIFELRYAATDEIQAVIMYYYKAQPDQKAIPEFLEKLVKEGKLEKEYIEKFKELDKLWKDIDHKIIREVGVEHLEKAFELTRDIINRFNKLLPEDIKGEELPEVD